MKVNGGTEVNNAITEKKALPAAVTAPYYVAF